MLKALITCLFMVTMVTAAAAQKAGIGAWENSRYTVLEWIESEPALAWYYNWRMDQIEYRGGRSRSVEFVPMIHSAKNVNDRIRSDLRVTTLLGFNEPDGKGGHQASLSVEDAIALWPKLEARGLRLGSPATTRAGTLGAGSWQRRFMDEVEARHLRVDFMAVHYYSKDGNVAAFKAWLVAVHAEYGRPIWVTEFARIDWNNPGTVSYAQSAAFAEAAIPMLESLPFVERHAWFAANPYPWQGSSPKINLLDDNLKLTSVGKTFERALNAIASLRVADAG